MTLKEQILLCSNENVIIKESPQKKPKKKKVKSKIKLSSLLEDLLLEEVDLSDGNKVIKALERGQIPGVKKKKFLKTSFKENEIIDSLNNIIKIVTGKVRASDINKYLFLIFKRVGNIELLDSFSDGEMNEIIDSMMAYFGNKNKREAQEDEETKKKFEEYENSIMNFEKDKEFEQWVNEKFAHKAKAKDNEINVIYDDGEWTVSIPKTFAAAKKLACMADRKAKWCTAASVGMFKTYSKSDNPLFIIRNEKKNVMYQMDWGKGGWANFMDEKDAGVPIEDIINKGIPNNLWKSIKNKEGESVYDKLEPAIRSLENKNKVPLDDINKTPAENLKGWNETVFITLDDFLEDVKGKEVPSLFKVSNESKNTMRDVLSGSFRESKKGAKRIAKYEKDGEVYYHLVPTMYGFNISHHISKKMYNIVLKDKGSSLSYVEVNDLLKSDLPDFFADKPTDDVSKTEGDMEGWNEYIYPSVGEFLREISNFQMPKLIGSAENFAGMLKLDRISQIGKVTKGKKTYYYLISKPGKTINFGLDSSQKKLERIAFQLTGNKLTVKTAKTIGQSELPKVLKEKLFTRYNSQSDYLGRNLGKEPGFQKIAGEDLKKVSKSEMPVLSFEHSGTKAFTNVNTFAKIMNIPNIGENMIDRIKRKIMNDEINPSNIIAFILSKPSNKKTFGFVSNDGFIRIFSEYSMTSYGFFSRSVDLSYNIRGLIYNNFLKNSNVFTKDEKHMIENFLNNKPFYTFKGGEKLKKNWGGFFSIEVNGQLYAREIFSKDFAYVAVNDYGRPLRGYDTARNDGETVLSKEKVKELEDQGLTEKLQSLGKIFR